MSPDAGPVWSWLNEAMSPPGMASPARDVEIKPLTRKNLARLDTLNGWVRHDTDSGYLFDDMKKTPNTDSGFEERAYENGILDPVASHPPRGFDTARHALARRRTSTQPSEKGHRAYSFRVSDSYNETKAADLVKVKMMRDLEDGDLDYSRHCGRALTETPPQDFNRGLSNPLPDVIEGLRTMALPNHLRHTALHQDRSSSLSFSHFAAEFKRTDGDLHQATVQAAYDGAVLVNARYRALEEARQRSTVAATLGKATKDLAVFTLVSDGKVAEVYGHHFEGGQYHQNLVASESLLKYPNRGRELIRNTQDYARSKSYELAKLLGAELEEEEEEVEVKAKKAVAKGW